jgi:hypothetical protein
MPYIINKYDGTELTILEDGSINTTTSLGLIGRNYFGYGEQQNENFVFLLENFANVNPPLKPIKGQVWFDTNENLLKVYNGTIWNVVGSAIVSETAPNTLTIGSLWLKTPANILYVYNGVSWTFIGPETAEGFGTTRAESTTLLDSANAQRPVILFKVNGKITAISSEVAFTLNPNTFLEGFSNIASGITVSSLMTFRGNLDGISERSRQLQTTRLINGVGFNGTNDITIKAATTNKLVPGNYIKGDQFDGASPETWAVDATPLNEGGKVVARNESGDFSARNITANLVTADVRGNVTAVTGTSFFNICYANKFEGAILTGNAATASRLETPRKINGVEFSGVEDITVPASAQTLTGTFINATVTSSNLQEIGTLRRLSISNEGISLGDLPQKLKINFAGSGPLIYSETGVLRIGSNGNPEFSFLDANTAASQGGPIGSSAFIPIGSSVIGLPAAPIRTVYANQLEGNAATSTLANSAINLSGGAAGTVVYQTGQGTTAYLPAGTPGYVLRAGQGNTIQWSPFANEPLVRNSQYLTFTNLAGNPVNFYDSQNQVTVALAASTINEPDKLVARDSSGNFSANTITASLNGNANTASRLQTPRSIDGVFFDGTENISLPSGVKAWVVFQGNTTSIIKAYNVNSVVLQSGGRYRINIASGVFSNGDFVAAGMAADDDHFVAFRASTATTLDFNTVDNGSGNNTPSTTGGRVMIMITG